MRVFRLSRLGFLAGQLGNFRCHSRFARYAEIWRDIVILDDRLGVFGAAGKPAGAALPFWQDFLDFIDERIDLHRKFLIGQRQHEAEKGTDTDEDQDDIYSCIHCSTSLEHARESQECQ